MHKRFDSDDNAWEQESSGEPDEPWKAAHEAWKKEVEKRQRHAPALSFWDEHLWEDFMRMIDRDELKVIAFYERYWNHSDRDRMVEEAMAMHYVREAFKKTGVDDPAESYASHYIDLELRDMGITDEGSEGFLDAKEQSLYGIGAYRAAREFSAQWKGYVFTLHDYNRLHKSVESISLHSGLACNKVVGGHVMGYQPFTIGGNIAQSKRALISINRAIDYLQNLRDHLFMDDAQYHHLTELALETRNAIAFRVLDLRNQFFDLS